MGSGIPVDLDPYLYTVPRQPVSVHSVLPPALVATLKQKLGKLVSTVSPLKPSESYDDMKTKDGLASRSMTGKNNDVIYMMIYKVNELRGMRREFQLIKCC